MALGPPGPPRERLHVIAMAMALVGAAVAGGVLGIVWQELAGNDEVVETTSTALR